MKKSKMNNAVQEFYEEMPYPNSKRFKSDYSWIIPPERKGAEILDLGCGTGEISNYLSQFGKVTGIDFSKSSIRIAKKNYPNVNFIEGNIIKLDLNKKFDYIYCIGVLHHIPGVKKALKAIKKHCKKETKIIVAVCNKYGMIKNKILKKKYKTRAGYRDFFENPYFREYTQNEFCGLVEECGFKVIKIERRLLEFVRLITGKNKLMRFILKKQ